MPTYDYQCRGCGTVTEVIHPMVEDGPSVCELCGGALRRVLYPTGIIFKGSGFYRNDSRSSSSSSVADSDKSRGGEKRDRSDGRDRSNKSEGSATSTAAASEGSSGSSTTDRAPSGTTSSGSDGSST